MLLLVRVNFFFSDSETLQTAGLLPVAAKLSLTGEKYGPLLRTIKLFDSPAAETKKIKMELNI